MSAGLFGCGAIATGLLGLRWGLVAAAAVTVLAVAGASGVRRLLARRTTAEGDPAPRITPLDRPLLFPLLPSAALLLGGAGIAVVPILVALGDPATPLQRWDALFHLSALQHIRLTGEASTLTFASLSTTDGSGGVYPAAFHDLAALVPFAPVPIVLNAATLVLALVPWMHGTLALARVLWPRLGWAPVAAGTAAAIAPAVPLNEWIHLAAIPNLVASSFLPGVLAALLAGFLAGTRAPRERRLAAVGPLLFVALVGAGGLGLMHPNVFIALCLFVGAAALVPALQQRRRRPLLARGGIIVAVVAALPVLAIAALPASAVAGDFIGGLAITPLRALGELLLGLLTVWPMATGPLVWLFAYLGLWAQLRRGSVLLLVVLAVPVVLYLDAAVDSPLRLSALWYSGQDRISMLLTLVVSLLVVPGLAHVRRLLRLLPAPRGRALALVGIAMCAVVAVTTYGPRLEYANRNLDLDLTGRARYFDSEEYAMLQEVGARMDTDRVLLASPFSGAAHLFAMTGQDVRFPVAGMNPTGDDGQLMDDVLRASTDPASCRRLEEANIGYVYVDLRPYNLGGSFTRLDQADPALGTVIGSTNHSMMLEVDC